MNDILNVAFDITTAGMLGIQFKSIYKVVAENPISQAKAESEILQGHCGSCWACCGAADSLSDCFCIHFGWVNSFLHAKTCKFILVMVANDSILCVRQNISVSANDIVACCGGH
ncbi:uncharacterized protein [Solanum lycopersicum]|uniref:uncharacterized protein n=1 Tax=Solanum lycopersicum TaxID=4081 RepID=UPI003749864A|nr:cathepsin B [Solanum lycopersicum]